MTDGDYVVRVIDFPVPIGGMVMPNDDGTYSIYLNARTSWELQRRAFRHELKHIQDDDFYNHRPIKEIENI